MCKGNDCTDTSTIVIPTGAAGVNGTNGVNGSFGGFSAKWNFDATTGGDPASTYLKFNSTLLSGVTAITVNNTNEASTDHSNFLLSLSNEVNGIYQFGLIRVFKEFDSNTFWAGRITEAGPTSNGHTYIVTHIESNGTFAADDDVVLSFAANGTSAEADKEIIYMENTNNSTSALVETIISTITIPAYELQVNGDQLEVASTISRVGIAPSSLIVRQKLAGLSITGGSTWDMTSNRLKLVVNTRLTRISPTAVYVNMYSYYIDDTGVMVPTFATSQTLAWVSNTPNNIDITGLSTDGANSVECNIVSIRKFDK
jgi:hypothetical protein